MKKWFVFLIISILSLPLLGSSSKGSKLAKRFDLSYLNRIIGSQATEQESDSARDVRFEFMSAEVPADIVPLHSLVLVERNVGDAKLYVFGLVAGITSDPVAHVIIKMGAHKDDFEYVRTGRIRLLPGGPVLDVKLFEDVGS